MDCARPALELKHIGDICPDKNVPVIAVFTKYDQFRREVRMKLEDHGRDIDDPEILNAEMERIFNEVFLANLKESPPIVRLERLHKLGEWCTDLIKTTADALSGSVVALMLLTVQKNNLELNVNQAVKWAHSAFQRGNGSTERVIKICILAFPSIWYLGDDVSAPRSPEQEVLPDMEDLSLSLFSLSSSSSSSRERANALFSKLRSFLADPPLSISGDGQTHHKLIVTILILEHACLFYASQSKPTRDEALARAYSQYCASGAHKQMIEQFSALPKEYSSIQFTEFILKHLL